MTQTTVATEVHETLDAHVHFASQITFDGVPGHRALRYDDERLLVRATDEEVCARVAGLIASGYLRLCGTKTQVYRDEGVPLVKAPPVPKPARRWLEPPPPAPPAPIEDSTFTPNLDAAALAKVLKDAARAGVPFCEECEKARRTQQRTADAVA